MVFVGFIIASELTNVASGAGELAELKLAVFAALHVDMAHVGFCKCNFCQFRKA